MIPQFRISARKIIWSWVAFVAVFTTALLLFPHSITPALFVMILIQTLLFLFCVAIVRHEPSTKNKFVFANFAALFSVAILGAIGPFIGPDGCLFTEQKYIKHYFDQYIAYGAFGFLLAFAIVYLTIDTLFRDFRSRHKYAIAVAIVGTFFSAYFNGFLVDRQFAYQSQDAKDFHRVDSVNTAYWEQYDAAPTPEDIAARVELYVYKNGREVATLHEDARLSRVEELYPYLEGKNYMTLLWKPANNFMINMNVLAIAFILLFFGYQYMKDPPQGAYVEKIVFLLLLFTSMEVLHLTSMIKALEWTTFASIFDAGQYATDVVLLLIAVFLALRLRFIMSAKGEFYEQELEASPAGITRWRDALDTMVVESFFNRKIVHGRLFAAPARPKSDPGH